MLGTITWTFTYFASGFGQPIPDLNVDLINNNDDLLSMKYIGDAQDAAGNAVHMEQYTDKYVVNQTDPTQPVQDRDVVQVNMVTARPNCPNTPSTTVPAGTAAPTSAAPTIATTAAPAVAREQPRIRPISDFTNAQGSTSNTWWRDSPDLVGWVDASGEWFVQFDYSGAVDGVLNNSLGTQTNGSIVEYYDEARDRVAVTVSLTMTNVHTHVHMFCEPPFGGAYPSTAPPWNSTGWPTAFGPTVNELLNVSARRSLPHSASKQHFQLCC